MLKTDSIFQNNMILQRKKELRFWGKGDVGKKVYVKIENIERSADVDEEGNWEVVLPAFEALEKTTVTISLGEETMIFSNVAIGEVWVAAGQSNMEFHMRYEKHLEEVRRNCTNKRIRFYDVPKISYEDQGQQFDYSRMGIWRLATEDDIEYFSAVGYYFGEKLEGEINVPIGIVGCNWGGTSSSVWVSPETIKNVGRKWNDRYLQKAVGVDWKCYWIKQKENILNDKGNPFENTFSEVVMPRTVTLKELTSIFITMDGYEPVQGLQPNEIPSCLYEHMVKKIANFNVRGILWYQGESDDENGLSEIYGDMLEALIYDWRKLWRDAEMPFLIVQLPGFEQWLDLKAKNYNIIRKRQEEVTKNVKGSYMCSISDIGEQYDIHPKEKRLVGHRLALLALGHVYDKNVLCDDPVIRKVIRKDGEIRIYFDNAGKGLRIEGDELNALKICSENSDLKFSVDIEGDCLKIMLDTKPKGEIEIAFASEQWYKVNLYNSYYIPARPFHYII